MSAINTYPYYEAERVQYRQGDVLPTCIPLPLLDEHEPEQGWEVEREATDEQGGDDAEQITEERDRLGNDPSDYNLNDKKADPYSPSGLCVSVADCGVLENTPNYVSSGHGSIDASRNKNDGKRDAECNSRDSKPSRKQCRTAHTVANKSVDQSSGDCVYEYLNQAKGPNRLDVVLGCVQLRHEAELADGERVGEHDIGDGEEGGRE